MVLHLSSYSYTNDSDTSDVSVIKRHTIFKGTLQIKLTHWHCVMFNPRLMYEMSLFQIFHLNIENISEIISVNEYVLFCLLCFTGSPNDFNKAWHAMVS